MMVVAPADYQDMEFELPRNAFLAEGHSVDVCSKGDVDLAQGVLGGSTTVDADISSVTPDAYDAVVFVGGGGASTYFSDENAHELVRKMHSSGKVVAAICIAPSTLANAGILEGKNVTAFPTEQANLEANNAEYTGNPVEVSGNIVTANGPGAANEFAHKIMELLEKG
jgi:protease I